VPTGTETVRREALPRLCGRRGFVIQTASPALEVTHLGARIARVDATAAERLHLDEYARVGGELLCRIEHVARQVAGVRDLDLEPALRDAHVHLERRRHRRDAQVHGGLALADFGQDLVRRVVQPDDRRDAADLDFAPAADACSASSAEDAALVLLAVELRQRKQVLAREVL